MYSVAKNKVGRQTSQEQGWSPDIPRQEQGWSPDIPRQEQGWSPDIPRQEQGWSPDIPHFWFAIILNTNYNQRMIG